MRKLIALLLCMALCLPALATLARAEEAEREIFTSGQFRYALLSDGTAEITGVTDSYMNFEIPDTLDGPPSGTRRFPGGWGLLPPRSRRASLPSETWRSTIAATLVPSLSRTA